MTMADTTAIPKATDMLAVKSRVSWGAIAAGAMIALAIYFLFTLLGVALTLDVAVNRRDVDLSAVGAVYSIATLLIAMFFGGWATSRLAVGESKLEAILYGIILWGVLFTGMLWMVSAGIRTGFSAIVGVASGAYSTSEGGTDVDKIADSMKRAGVDEAQVNRYRDYARTLKRDPGAASDVARDATKDVDIDQLSRRTLHAAWWSLGGVLLSLATVVVGSLTGSGEMLQPVPILGVRRAPSPPRDPRV